MRALRSTTEHLAKYTAMHLTMEEYAGPQCYPQLLNDLEYFANNEPAAVALDNERRLDMLMAREQMRCWLQCSNFRKLRLVDRRSFDAVAPCRFGLAKAGVPDDKWGAWFAGASGRFAVCQAPHA